MLMLLFLQLKCVVGLGFTPRAGAAQDSIDVNVVIEHQITCKRQEGQLSGHKAARIGHIPAAAYCATIELRQTVDKRIIIGLNTVQSGRDLLP